MADAKEDSYETPVSELSVEKVAEKALDCESTQRAVLKERRANCEANMKE